MFEDDGVKRRRSFSFEVNDNNAFTMTVEEMDTGINTGTTIFLSNLKDGYFYKVPSKQQTIINQLIRHFLQVLITPNCPIINLIDNQKVFDLKEALSGQILGQHSSTSDVAGFGEFAITHIMVRRAATNSGI